MWVHKGKEEEQISRLKILSDGSLSLENVDKADTGEYRCELESDESEGDNISGRKFEEDDGHVVSRKRLYVRSKFDSLFTAINIVIMIMVLKL